MMVAVLHTLCACCTTCAGLSIDVTLSNFNGMTLACSSSLGYEPGVMHKYALTGIDGTYAVPLVSAAPVCTYTLLTASTAFGATYYSDGACTTQVSSTTCVALRFYATWAAAAFSNVVVEMRVPSWGTGLYSLIGWGDGATYTAGVPTSIQAPPFGYQTGTIQIN